MGIFIQGQKIGYSMIEQKEETVGGKPMQVTSSRSIINLGMLGQDMTMRTDTMSVSTLQGKPSLVKMETESSGRVQRVEASFIGDKVHISIDNSGNKSKKVLNVPKDAPIVDDPTTEFLKGNNPANKASAFYILDPTTLTFVKNTVKLVGTKTITLQGKQVQATLIEVAEPRMTMKVYVTSKGDLVKIESIAGLEMWPLSKEEALAESDTKVKIDLAEATRLTIKGAPNNLMALPSATYRFEGVDLKALPSDSGQTVTKSDNVWVVRSAPNRPNLNRKASFTTISIGKTDWLKPGLNVPSNDPSMVKLANQIVAGEKNPVKASMKVAQYVHEQMRFDAGIGVLRDAREILKTKVGVCRDYAVLMATLLRAAKIPTRVVSGLVTDSGAFYYHAWVECWDGAQWYGLDATRARHELSGGYIKLAQGSVEDVFLYTFLDSARVTYVK